MADPIDTPDTTVDEGLTARERRAQRVKAQGRRQAPKKMGKTVGIVIIVALLVAGGVWALRQIPIEDAPGHEHVVYRMFAAGQEIDFNHPQFDLSQTQFFNAHLHLSGAESTAIQYVIHNEGTRRVSLDIFFETLNVDVSKNHVRLAPVQGNTEYRNNDTHSWQLWVDRCADGEEGNNFHKEGKLFDYKPRHHDRMLLTFAPSNSTAESLASEFGVISSHEELNRDRNETCTPNRN